MERTSFSKMRCSLARALEVMGDWWAPLIIRDVFLGVTRFGDIAEDLGISRNLLTRRLNALNAAGIIVKSAYQQRPPRYEYKLAEAGSDLIPAMMALTAWGDRWVGPKQGAPILFRCAKCAKQFEPLVICSECGEPIRADAVKVQGGPGGAVQAGTKVIAKRLKSI
jgi:DNA-binding HxlR family transcriptional regulator